MFTFTPSTNTITIAGQVVATRPFGRGHWSATPNSTDQTTIEVAGLLCDPDCPALKYAGGHQLVDILNELFLY